MQAFLLNVIWLSVKWALKNHVIDKVIEHLVEELEHKSKQTDNTLDDSASGKIREHKEDIKSWLKDRL